MFRGLYDVARFQYLLWQQHCNLHHAHQANDYFGPPDSFSFMRQLGPSTCLLCPDTRAHRSTNQILAPATYEAMFSGYGWLLTQISSSCFHRPEQAKHAPIRPSIFVLSPEH